MKEYDKIMDFINNQIAVTNWHINKLKGMGISHNHLLVEINAYNDVKSEIKSIFKPAEKELSEFIQEEINKPKEAIE